MLSVIFNKKNLILGLFFLTTTVFAANGRVYLGADLGINSANVSREHASITYYGGMLKDVYPIKNNNEIDNLLLGVNAGYELTVLDPSALISVGLGFYGMPSDYLFRGQVVETAIGDPSSLLYDYHFHLQSMRLMLETRFSWMINQFSPFIDLGIGGAWTKVSHYREIAVDNLGYVALPPFHSHTNANFSYQAGLGLSYSFNFTNCKDEKMHERISLGYRYVNLGKVKLGNRGAVYPYRLSLGQLSSNEFYLSFTHIF